MGAFAAIAGIALILVGVLFLLLGGIGLAAKVIRDLDITTLTGSGTVHGAVELPDVGGMLAAILKAIADAPAYVVCVALGLVLIFFGTALLGVEYHIGSMCISLGNGCGAP